MSFYDENTPNRQNDKTRQKQQKQKRQSPGQDSNGQGWQDEQQQKNQNQTSTASDAAHRTPLSNRRQADASPAFQPGMGSVPSDVQGSYTGTGADGTPPVQDADDL